MFRFRLKSGYHAAVLSCLSLACAVPSIAQTSTTTVVTGAREPLAPERLVADVAVISNDTVRDTQADSLADLLRRETGIQLSRNGGPGHSTGIFLRGAGSQQSVLLVDGVRIGSATLGFAAFEALGLSQVDRVEVLRGPGSSLYGADAVGGVVQVFTPTGGPQTQADARVAAGGYGSREASANLRGGGDGWDAAAGLSTERSRGVSSLRPGDAFGNHNPDRDGHRLDAGQARLGWRPASGHRIGLTLLRTELDSQYDASEYAPPLFAQDPTPDFRTRQTTQVAALDWRGTVTTSLTGSARASRSVDDARNGASDIDTFRTVRQQVGAQLAWRTGTLGQIVGALEHGVDEARSSSYDADVERRNNAAVLEWTGSAGGWSWQADGRRDDSSDFGAVTTGRLGAAVRLAPGLRLRTLAGTTFRAPSFNDLYFPNYGVATLRPERGRSIEFGLDWTAGDTRAAATVYRNRVRELIGYESDRARCPPDPGYNFGCAANVARSRLQGATLSGTHRRGAVAVKTQIDFLEARDTDTGRRLARRAAHQATVGLDWTLPGWTLSASLLRLGERPDGGRKLDAETTLDLAARWQFDSAWQVTARLLNATDRDTEPARDYQGLGRQAWLGVRYTPRL